MVARHLNGDLPRRYAGYTAWRGIAAYALDPDLAGETMGPGMEVGHVPMGPEHTYWFATQRAPQGHAAPGGEHAHLTAVFGGWPEPIPSLLAGTDPAAVLRNDLYDRKWAGRWARQRAVIVGDAAHVLIDAVAENDVGRKWHALVVHVMQIVMHSGLVQAGWSTIV